MIVRVLQWPLAMVMVLAFGVAMFVPALIALRHGDYHMARSFFYGAVTFVILINLVAAARGGSVPRDRGIYQHLREVLLVYTLMPAALAIPFQEAVQTISLSNAYFEMLSAMTTTGASTLRPAAAEVEAILIWRGIVAWLGGGFFWVTVIYVFVPLSIGGYELRARDEGRLHASGRQNTHRPQLADGIRSAGVFYLGVTFVVWMALLVASVPVENAVLRAMAIVSTSGIVGPSLDITQMKLVEMVSLVALLCVVTRAFLPFPVSVQKDHTAQTIYLELRLFVTVIAVLTLISVAYHTQWAVRLGVDAPAVEFLNMVWGQIYTFASFAASFGEVSVNWNTSADFSGQRTSYILLIALATVGGGVATACGGVKLLRLYVLVVAFRRELEQASLPNLVPRQDLARFSLSEAAPRAAWVFLMMFLFALAVTTVAFGYLGLGFENAMIYAVSALSTTGPMIVFSQEMGADLTTASQGVKWVYCVAMIAGRFEMLAILTLFAPNLWRS